MKALKYAAGIAAFALFFLIVDQTGLGFGKHMAAIKKWASGESEKLRFEAAWKDQ